MVDFSRFPIAAAIRTDKDFSTALRSDVEVIFLLQSNIMTINQCIKEIHGVGKKAFVHVDFAEGLGKDRFGINFLAKQGVDGVLTTRTNIVKAAKDAGMITVQRFFIVDSHSVDTAVESIKQSRPDIIEMMPGIVTKKIAEFSAKVQMPIIAGGLVEELSEVQEALKAGATAVSTGNSLLWSKDIDLQG